MSVSDSEDGRVGMLFVVLMGLVALACVVMSNVTAIQIQYRQALSCVDALALAGTGRAAQGDYFCAGCEQPKVVIATDARQRVEEYFSIVRDSACRIGDDVVLDSVELHGEDVAVRVRVQSSLVMTPGLLSDLLAPEFIVEGKARILER